MRGPSCLVATLVVVGRVFVAATPSDNEEDGDRLNDLRPAKQHSYVGERRRNSLFAAKGLCGMVRKLYEKASEKMKEILAKNKNKDVQIDFALKKNGKDIIFIEKELLDREALRQECKKEFEKEFSQDMQFTPWPTINDDAIVGTFTIEKFREKEEKQFEIEFWWKQFEIEFWWMGNLWTPKGHKGKRRVITVLFNFHDVPYVQFESFRDWIEHQGHERDLLDDKYSLLHTCKIPDAMGYDFIQGAYEMAVRKAMSLLSPPPTSSNSKTPRSIEEYYICKTEGADSITFREILKGENIDSFRLSKTPENEEIRNMIKKKALIDIQKKSWQDLKPCKPEAEKIRVEEKLPTVLAVVVVSREKEEDGNGDKYKVGIQYHWPLIYDSQRGSAATIELTLKKKNKKDKSYVYDVKDTYNFLPGDIEEWSYRENRFGPPN